MQADHNPRLDGATRVAEPDPSATATPGPSPERRRVLVVGLDAADPLLLLEAIDDGRLPNLRRMQEAGAWGIVTSPRGFGSGAVWPSFATGVSPARHGRYYYTQVRPGSYEATRFEADEFTADPVWAAISDAGRRVAVFDVPKVALTPGLNGVQAVDWISHGPVYAGLRTWPPAYADELTAEFGADPLPKCDFPGGRDTSQMREFLAVLGDRIDQRERCTRAVWADPELDLMVTVFAEPHCVGHQAWHVRDVDHPLHDADAHAALGDPVVDVYAAIDAAIGRHLDEIDDDTVMIVFSGTGMGPNYTGNNLLDEVLHRLEGMPATVRRRWTRRAKLVAKRYLPRGIRQRGRPLKRKIEEGAAVGDRSRRRAFAVPHNDISGAIRLNIVGREQRGVLPPDEVDDFVEELRTELLALRNADTGRPVVDDVVRIADDLEGEHLDRMPDLFVLWNREAPIDRVASPRVGTVEFVHRGNRTGDHNPESCLFAVGAGIRPGEIQGVTIHDFAPTLAALLGVEPPFSDGAVIEALVPRDTAVRV